MSISFILALLGFIFAILAAILPNPRIAGIAAALVAAAILVTGVR